MRRKIRSIPWTWVLVAFIIAAGFLYLSERDKGAADDTWAVIRNGRPTLLYFYSQTCPYCKDVEPKVDQFEAEHGHECDVLRLDMGTAAGKELGQAFQVRGVPTLVVLDEQGREVNRSEGAQ